MTLSLKWYLMTNIIIRQLQPSTRRQKHYSAVLLLLCGLQEIVFLPLIKCSQKEMCLKKILVREAARGTMGHLSALGGSSSQDSVIGHTRCHWYNSNRSSIAAVVIFVHHSSGLVPGTGAPVTPTLFCYWNQHLGGHHSISLNTTPCTKNETHVSKYRANIHTDI